MAYFASHLSHMHSLTCLGFGLVPLLGTVGIFVGWTPSAYNSAWHMAANTCHMNEPDGEVASGVLSPVWLWPRALPSCHSQDTGAQKWQLFLQRAWVTLVPVQPRGATDDKESHQKQGQEVPGCQQEQAPRLPAQAPRGATLQSVRETGPEGRSYLVSVGARFLLVKFFPILTWEPNQGVFNGIPQKHPDFQGSLCTCLRTMDYHDEL